MSEQPLVVEVPRNRAERRRRRFRPNSVAQSTPQQRRAALVAKRGR